MNILIQRFRAVIATLAFFLHAPTSLRAQGAAGVLDPAFGVGSGVNGFSVNSIAVQPDGKILIAGSFGSVDGQTRSSIARLQPNGSVEDVATFDSGAGVNGVIRSIAVQPDGKIVIAGAFTTVNGQARNRIARLNPNGSLESLATFNPGSGADSDIFSVVLQVDGKILIGGAFTAVNGEPRGRIARLNANGTLESTATFDIGTGVSAGSIFAVSLQPDGKILVGGGFGMISGQPRTCIARLLANGTVESTATFNVGTGANGTVLGIGLHANGKIVLGGNFVGVSGQPRNHLARLNADGSLEGTTTFNAGSGVGSVVQCVQVQQDGKILIGGGFSTVNGQPRSCFARLLSDGTLESSSTFQMGTGANAPVLCTAVQTDGKILLGGQFTTVSGQSRNRIARLTNAIVHTGPVHELVWSFHQPPKNPNDGLLALGPDGYFWGMTDEGGGAGEGAIYKVNGDGSDWQMVISFTGEGGTHRGQDPSGGLCSDGMGYLWGVTRSGGTFDLGTIFKVNALTGDFTTLVDFTYDGSTNRGANPVGELVRDGSGNLWGVTSHGGAFGYGTVFKVNIGTGVLTTVVEFTDADPAHRGAGPNSGLVSDGAGSFWGTTTFGGTGSGTVFKIDQSTGVLTTLLDMPGATGQPISELVADGAGYFWGTTYTWLFKVEISTGTLSNVVELGGMAASRLMRDEGFLWGTMPWGNNDIRGVIFKVNIASGEFTVVRNFTLADAVAEGSYPNSGLISDGAGSFLGTTSAGGPTGGGTVYKFNPNTGQFTKLTGFTDELTAKKGNFPYAGLVSDGAGFLWGGTQHGGLGNGTVFKLDETTGLLTAVIEFTDKGTENRGAEPRAMLTKDGGFLWGSTSEGGTENAGTVFKLNAATGELETVHEFTPSDHVSGARPNAELISDGEGFFWGTTFSGGAFQLGAIFKVNASTGELVTVYDDFWYTSGYTPYAALTPDGTGNFWGTTNRDGGSASSGTVFKIEADTAELTTMTTFTGLQPPNPGTEPRAKLFDDGAGYFWGITSEGGLPGRDRGLGTIYKVHAATGAMKSVIQFTGTSGANKGSEPRAQLIPDQAGFLWGTTWKGGTYNEGTVFKLNRATGELTTVMEFTGFGGQLQTGSLPGYGSLLFHSDGNIYGTTQGGGPEGGGTIFRLRFGPTPVTLAANMLDAETANLHGTINPNGNATTVIFEIGTSPSLIGATQLQAAVSGAGIDPVPYNQIVTELQPSTTYYYRIVGTNAENAVPQRGVIRSFNTTPNLPPVVTLIGDNPVTLEAGPNEYTDAGAAATDAEDGVLVAQMVSNTVASNLPGVYIVTWKVTDSGNQARSVTRVVNVVDTTAPSVTAPANVSVNTLNPNGAVVDYPAATASDAVGVIQIQYSHPSGGTFPRGSTTVTVTASDAAGNQGTGTFIVRVTLAEPIHQALWLRGSPVPGAGVDARIPAGSRWESLGVPAISSTGEIAYIGKWRTGQTGGFGKGIFLGDDLLAKIGDAPANGTTFRGFKDPVFVEDSSSLLVPATLGGTEVKSGDDSVLFRFVPEAEVLVREGDETDLGAGIRIANIIGVTASEDGVLMLAEVRGGRPAVTPANRVALFASEPGGLVSLVRTGQTMFGKTIKSLHLLQSINGSPGHGRGELSDAGIRFIARFTDESQAIVQTTSPGAHTALVASGEVLDLAAPTEKWKSFGGGVSSSADGTLFSFLARVMAATGGPKTAWTEGIFLGSGSGIEEVVRLGEPAPSGAVGNFAGLLDPVLAADGAYLAFLGKTKQDRKTSWGIFVKKGDAPLTAVTTLDTPPAELESDIRWKSFDSLAAPGGGIGPIFTASLRRGNGVNATNDEGLWAVDTAGALRCLVRKGDMVSGKAVKAIQVLRAVRGIPGVTRAFNARAEVVWQALFTDRTNGIIITTVP